MSFVHLNVHSHYSLLDALGSPKDIVKRIKKNDMKAVGITDNSYLYGAIEFYKAAKDQGIKPIIGVDFYMAPNSRFDKSSSEENKPFRLTVLAKNHQGYQNLLKLSSLASLEGFYYRPRVDIEILEKHKAGLIVLSGGRWGEINQHILLDDSEKLENAIRKYQTIFGENFYLEIQRHPEIKEYAEAEPKLLEISKNHNIPIVATHSPHYLDKNDALPHDILVCIGTQTNIHDDRRKKYFGDFSIKTTQEMEEIFKDLPEAIKNTQKIADQINLELEFGKNLIPEYKTPNGESAKDYLRKLCEEGLNELYQSENYQEAKKQLDYELEIVNNMGFNDYFLIVWDFIAFAKSQGIAVGPGRGSAAGAIIAYTLKITELDPLKNGLIFERFLNPARVSMPDIDIDFADHRRHEVLDYTIEKYGKDSVSQVITYGTMAAKAAVRDVGRGMGYPYSEVDAIARAIPGPVLGKHTPLEISVQKDPELSHIYQSDQRAKELLDNAIKLEGTVRHAGTHACAVMISGEPLVNYTPLQRSTDGSNGIVTQYSMKPLEEIGLLKMDFLGLKNLTIIERTLNLIKKTKAKEIDISKIPMDDEKTFELFQKGDTTGVFQLESSGMRRYIRELKPTAFEDIVAMISLYRPGPMEWIPQYIKGKHQPETVHYADPAFEEILRETNGVAIYQEQIMQISQKFSGFSMAEADILRKAVGKKIPELLAEQKEKFVDGAVRQGHQKDHAIEIFEKVVEPFAGYGFNKSHAACYAMISYRTSYLKANYPTEFMAALLTSDHGNTERIALEIQDCEDMGIDVLPPSINESFADFTVVEDGKIRFGLAAIKGVGDGPIEAIIKERKKQGKFNSLEDLAIRLDPKLLNKKTIESLAYSGALDEFGERRALAENYDQLSNYSKSFHTKSENENQTDLFGMFEEGNEISTEPLVLTKVSPLSVMEKLKLEKQYMGLFVSGHPLKGLKSYIQQKAKLIENINQKDVGKPVKVAGLLTNLKTVMTKSGKAMAYAELDDNTGRINIVFFPKVFENFKFKLQGEQIMYIKGKVNVRNNQYQIGVDDLSTASLDTMIKNAKEAGVYQADQDQSNDITVFNDTLTITVPETFTQENFKSLKELLLSIPGDSIVELRIKDGAEYKNINTKIKIDSALENLNKIKKLLG
ncbi:DNA polymerase III subunit alpha [Candidatus Peregrinibacteria bacterium]|nr:DNA polymerase III subunit alpha [Candidatus Peregrinibacteria bacterium]